jgi:hypothetical protein
MALEPGLRATFRHTVTEADTAMALGSGEVPVLATPRALALAERATVAAGVRRARGGRRRTGGPRRGHPGGGGDGQVPPRGRRGRWGGQVSELRHHPRSLPPEFSQFRVEEGGVGAGTVHSFRMTTGGQARDFRMRVQEPEPGRLLTESDDRSSMTNDLGGDSGGAGLSVRVETRWQGGGVGRLFERLFAPRVLRRLYAEELERLAKGSMLRLASEGPSAPLLSRAFVAVVEMMGLEPTTPACKARSRVMATWLDDEWRRSSLKERGWSSPADGPDFGSW